jgi:hypothetical protein
MGTFNDHPKGVQPSGWKRGAPKGDDMVCSTWRHVAVRKNGDGLANRPEHKVKRACFKLGIGRELYTAPRIWIYAQNRDGSANCNIKQGQNGKYQCYDEFSVERIDIRNHEIIYVSVRNDSTGRVVYTWAKQEYQAEPQTNNQPANAPTREMLEEMSGLVAELAKARNVDNDTVLKGVLSSKAAKDSGISNGEVKTSRQAMAVIGQLKAWLRKG